MSDNLPHVPGGITPPWEDDREPCPFCAGVGKQLAQARRQTIEDCITAVRGALRGYYNIGAKPAAPRATAALRALLADKEAPDAAE